MWNIDLLVFYFIYLTTHSTHFIYGYMASDIWLRTILIVRKETRCCHIGYSFRLDRIAHTTAFVTPVVEHWLEVEHRLLYVLKFCFKLWIQLIFTNSHISAKNHVIIKKTTSIGSLTGIDHRPTMRQAHWAAAVKREIESWCWHHQRIHCIGFSLTEHYMGRWLEW